MWPFGPYPASFLGFIHPGQASPFAAPHLNHMSCLCPLRDHFSEALSSGPEKVPGSRMLANPGLRNGTSPSAPTTQVKGLRAYTMPPELDASSWLGQSYNQDEIQRWLRQCKKSWRWCEHGSMTKTYSMTLTVRSSLQKRLLPGFGHFPSASLGTQLM